MFDVIGDPEFLHQPGLQSIKEQILNQHKLYQRLAELTPPRTSAEWCDLFRAARIPCMPVRDMADILGDPHLTETGFFTQHDHPSEGKWNAMSHPAKYSANTLPTHRPPPSLGEHSAEIRAELSALKKRKNQNHD